MAASVAGLAALLLGLQPASLIERIDQTVTPLGARRLARWVAYPLLDCQEIRGRQDAVAALAALGEILEQRGDMAPIRIWVAGCSTGEEAYSLAPDGIFLSNGPGDPAAVTYTVETVKSLLGKVPIFGICLGHQSIGQVFGGKVVRARKVMHGKTSPIHHRTEGVFRGLSQPFEATRYHSLVVEKETLPDCLEITAWTETESGEMDEIMGLRHRDFVVQGVQFHPESILTEHGHQMLKNFLDGR